MEGLLTSQLRHIPGTLCTYSHCIKTGACMRVLALCQLLTIIIHNGYSLHRGPSIVHVTFYIYLPDEIGCTYFTVFACLPWDELTGWAAAAGSML